MELRSISDFADKSEDRGFRRNDDDDGWDISWGNYDYWILDSDLSSDARILDWVQHLGRKTWKGMTLPRMIAFINAARGRLQR